MSPQDREEVQQLIERHYAGERLRRSERWLDRLPFIVWSFLGGLVTAFIFFSHLPK